MATTVLWLTVLSLQQYYDYNSIKTTTILWLQPYYDYNSIMATTLLWLQQYYGSQYYQYNIIMTTTVLRLQQLYMQNFITLGQPLLGEKYVARKERENKKGLFDVKLCLWVQSYPFGN